MDEAEDAPHSISEQKYLYLRFILCIICYTMIDTDLATGYINLYLNAKYKKSEYRVCTYSYKFNSGHKDYNMCLEDFHKYYRFTNKILLLPIVRTTVGKDFNSNSGRNQKLNAINHEQNLYASIRMVNFILDEDNVKIDINVGNLLFTEIMLKTIKPMQQIITDLFCKDNLNFASTQKSINKHMLLCNNIYKIEKLTLIQKFLSEFINIEIIHNHIEKCNNAPLKTINCSVICIITPIINFIKCYKYNSNNEVMMSTMPLNTHRFIQIYSNFRKILCEEFSRIRFNNNDNNINKKIYSYSILNVLSDLHREEIIVGLAKLNDDPKCLDYMAPIQNVFISNDIELSVTFLCAGECIKFLQPKKLLDVTLDCDNEMYENILSSQTDEICGICIDKFDSSMCNLQCNHKYCYNCITPWYNTFVLTAKKPNCPLCRDNIKNITFNDRSNIKLFHESHIKCINRI
jgi:hypothetical protein